MRERPALPVRTSLIAGLARSRLASAPALVAALALALQPLFSGIAQAQVIVDPTAPIQFRPGLSASPGGAPVVDITTPSFGGPSHNRFERFDVDTRGVILNSGLGGDSILGGRIGANPNLVRRQPARTILNEVTGADSSLIAGPTEVFGARADVIIANPNGVGCVGCAFINTGRVTLSTGSPVPDYVRGTVDFDVRRGAIEISGAGLSAPPGMQPLGDVDLVGRRIGIDGPVVAADRVRLRAGAIRYEPGGDIVAPLAGAEALAGLAIAGSAAGTIAAGSISLLSRDVDLGIALAGDLAAHADSIVVTSFGDVALGGTRADLDLLVDARGDVLLAGEHEAGRILSAQGRDVTLAGRVAAGQAVTVEARGTLESVADIASGGAVGLLGTEAARLSGDIRAGGALALEGGDLEASGLSASGTAVTVAARSDVSLWDTQIAAQGDAAVTGRDVTLGAGSAFGAPGRLFVGARRDFLNATILDHPRLSLAIGRSFLNAATGAYIDDVVALSLTGDLVNAGLIQARLLARIAAEGVVVLKDGIIDAPDLSIAAAGDIANAGILQGRDRLALAADTLLNAAPGRILGEAVTVEIAGGLDNLGAVLAPGTLDVVAGGAISNDGLLAAGGALTLAAASYVAGSPAARLAAASASLVLAGALDNFGAITVDDALAILAASARNRAGALVSAGGDLDLAVAGALDNEGVIASLTRGGIAAGSLTVAPEALVYAPELVIAVDAHGSIGGEVLALDGLVLVIGGALNATGAIRAGGDLTLTAGALELQTGARASGAVVDLVVAGDASVAGSLEARDLLLLEIGGALSVAGDMRVADEDGEIGILVGGAATLSGTIAAPARAVLSAQSLSVAVGGALAARDLALGLGHGLVNAGAIVADGDLVIRSGFITNAGVSGAHAFLGGRDLDIEASGAVNAGAFSVTEGRASARLLAGTSNLDLFGVNGVAQGRFAFGENLAFGLSGQGLSVPAGRRIMAAGDLTLVFGGSVSVSGIIASGGDLALASTGGSIDLGAGGLLFTLSDAQIEAAGGLSLVSAAIEALGRIDVAVGGGVALGRAGGLTLQFSHSDFVYGGNAWRLDYYREYETSPASLVHAGGDLTIAAWSLDNHASTIFAGGDMTVSVANLWSRVRLLQESYNLFKLTGADRGYRGSVATGTWSVTPAVVQAGGALIVDARQIFSNEGAMSGFTVGISSPSVSVGISDPNVYTAPPSLPDAVIDLARFAVATPGFTAGTSPTALVEGGARYLVSSPVADIPRYDADGLPSPTREPTWILRQVGAPEGGLVFLADPISERRLIARALAEETGRALLDPQWGDAIGQQEALYEGTVAFLLANPEIALGRELTQAERARVAAPMLWYVEREIDGVRVLAPQLILPPDDLARYAYDPAGSLVSASDLFVTGERVVNRGSLVARESLVIDAGSFLNEQRVATARRGVHVVSAAQAGGAVLAGELLIRSDGDIVSRGGLLYGETGVTLLAGGDVRFEAQAVFNDILVREKRWSQRTVSLEHVASRVGSGGDLTIVSGGGFALVGSSLTASGDVSVSAREGITLAAVVDEIESAFTTRSRGLLSSSSSLDASASAIHRGAAIGAGRDVTLLAGGDVLVVASDLAAGRDLLLAAGAGPDGRADASVTILAGVDEASRLTERRSSGFGLFVGGGRLDFHRTSLDREENAVRANAPSTLIAGGDVTVLAPGDLTLAGSVVGAGGIATVSAGRDLLLLPGQEGAMQASLSRRSGFGFGFSSGGGGASLSFGLARSSVSEEAMRGTDVGSSVAGVEGVLLEAGRDARLVAAQVRSPGDVDIFAGRDLAILPGLDAERRARSVSQSFAGITASVGTNVVGAASSLASSVETFNSGYGGSTWRAIGMASGAMQAADSLRALSDPSLSASLSIGASRSRSSQSETAAGVVPAFIEAGRDLTLAAGRDLALVGAQAGAGRDLALIAGRDVVIESAQALFAAQTRSSSASASLGISASLSAVSGPNLALTLSADAARAHSDSTGLAQVEANIVAGERLLLASGGDALVAGAHLRAREIDLLVGGDLTIASRLDEASLRGSSAQAGFSLSLSLTGGPSSLSIDAGAGRDRADEARVARQTAIIAQERLDASVEGHTQIDGAILAALSGDLLLDTGTLGFSDITEAARSESQRASVGPSLGSAGSQPGLRVEGDYSRAETDGVARATIGDGEIVIRDEAAQNQDLAALNRDLDAAQEVLRAEAVGVRFYASDTALRELATGFVGTRANLEALSQADVGRLLDDIDLIGDLIANALGLVGDRGGASAAEREAALDLMQDVLSGQVALDVLAACGRQGFNLFDWLFTPAYASDPCALYSQRVIDLCLDGFNALQTLLVENTADVLERFASAAENDPDTLANLLKLLAWTPSAVAFAPLEYAVALALREAGVNPEEYVEAFVARQINALLSGAVSPEFAVGSTIAVVIVATKVAPKAGAGRIIEAAEKAFRRDQSAIQSASRGLYDPQAWRRYYDDFYDGNVTSTTVPPFSAPNVRLAGQTHPDTRIAFDQRGFPIFDDVAVFDTRLPAGNFHQASYQSQMRRATLELRTAIERDPRLGQRFSPAQIRAIEAGRPNIPGLIWHHHQVSGRMQLIPTNSQKLTGHIGGAALSGGL